MKYVYGFLVSIVGIGVLIVGWVKYQESSGIFFPIKYPKSRIDRLPDELEFVTFPSLDGVKVTGLLKQGRPDSPAIVFTHGNAGHMIDRVPWIQGGVPAGWTALLLDYRGYGLSDGSPSVAGLKKDARAAVEFVLERTDNDVLYLYGRSLGVPLAAYASQYHKTEGIILESGLPDARSVAPHFMPMPGVQYLVGIDLDTVEYIQSAQKTHGPMRKLVVHGTEDRILPVQLGRKLFEAIPEPKEKLFVEGAGHNNLRLIAGDRYDETVRKFLTETSGES